jgi:transketolase
MDARDLLDKRGIHARVVSMPSWELFEAQDEAYRNSVLPPDTKARVVVEAGVSMGWHKYAGDRGRFVCQDSFGASAPHKALAERFGFTPERVADEAMKALRP